MAGRTPDVALTPSDSLTPADDLTVPGGGVTLDDYEFSAGVQNHYRVKVYSDGLLLHTYTDAITPILSAPWVKSATRPYLNRTVRVAEAGDFTRRARTGLFDVVGAEFPVAVTDVRSSRSYSITLATDSEGEAADLETLLDSGEALFFQFPDGYPLPTGYYAVGDVTRSWHNAPPVQVPQRWFTLPLTSVAAPSSEVVGATTNWEAVVDKYATWNDVVTAVPTWNDLTSQIAGQGDVVVDVAVA